MSWVQTVVKPETTITFRGSTPHYISRFSSHSARTKKGDTFNTATLIVGGHIKRPTADNIRDLLAKQHKHLKNPNMTNADVKKVPLAEALLEWLNRQGASLALADGEASRVQNDYAQHVEKMKLASTRLRNRKDAI